MLLNSWSPLYFLIAYFFLFFPFLVCLPCPEKGSTNLEWPFPGKGEECGYGWIILKVNISGINSSLPEQTLTLLWLLCISLSLLSLSFVHPNPKLPLNWNSQLKYRWKSYRLLRSTGRGSQASLHPAPCWVCYCFLTWSGCVTRWPTVCSLSDLLGHFLQRLCFLCALHMLPNTSGELIFFL